MADGMEILRQKFRANHRAYRPEDGIFKLDTCLLTEAFVAETSLDPSDDYYHQLCYALERVLAMNSYHARVDQDTVWVAEDEWVETLSWYILKKPRTFEKAWEYWIAACFDALDEDKDGYINEERFTLFYQTTNRKDDKAFAKCAFAAFDTKTTGGLVSRKQYVDAYVKYISDPDTTYEELPLY